MYEAFDDPYCYEGTPVLKNKLDFRTQAELDKAEKFLSAQRAEEPLPKLPKGGFSYRHYCAIHRHLFQDVYSWAGRIRKVVMSKDGSLFCLPEHIDTHMCRLFDDLSDENQLRDLELATFADEAAHVVAELNAIHPFREGNGRTQNAFLDMLATKAGHPLDLDRLDPQKTLAAMIASFRGDEKPLAAMIISLMRARS